MGETKFTAGPWRASQCAFDKKSWAELNDPKQPLTIVRAKWDGFTGEVVAVVWGDSDEEERASAGLIAEAPDIFGRGLKLANEVGGLRAFESEIRGVIGHTNWSVLMDRLEAFERSLAKARGDQ